MLKTLDVGYGELDERDIHAVVHAGWTNLETLKLSGNSINNAAIAELVQQGGQLQALVPGLCKM